jgi:signal-transduction protein with cAMP-binding, CBS, and nucleotidyltransferase domain
MSLKDPNGAAAGAATADQGLTGLVSRTRVADIVGDRSEVYCLGPNQTVEEAARKLKAWRIRTVTVCDDSGNVVGVLGQSDISTRVVASGLDPHTTAVRDVMTADPQCVDLETDLLTVVHLMSGRGISHIVLTRTTAEGEQFYGMISASDVMGVLARQGGPDSIWMQDLAGQARH